MPIFFEEWIEYRRFFDHLFEAALGGIRFLLANQQVDAADLRQVEQHVGQPDFADKAGYADEHDVLTGECPPDGEHRRFVFVIEMHNRTRWRGWPAVGADGCRFDFLEWDVQLPCQCFRGAPTVRTLLTEEGKTSTGTDHGIQ